MSVPVATLHANGMRLNQQLLDWMAETLETAGERAVAATMSLEQADGLRELMQSGKIRVEFQIMEHEDYRRDRLVFFSTPSGILTVIGRLVGLGLPEKYEIRSSKHDPQPASAPGGDPERTEAQGVA